MSECVMSVYGIARLLATREVGPAKLVPPIQAFGMSMKQHWHAVNTLFDELCTTAADDGELSVTVGLLQTEAQRICGELDQGFNQPLKLRARQRLELERMARRLGGELEAMRWLTVVTAAALYPRDALLSPKDLLVGHWHTRPMFATEKVKLVVPQGLPAKLYGDPQVLRALLEHHVRSVCAAGINPPVLGLKINGSKVELRVGESNGPLNVTIEQVALPMRVALSIEGTVMAAAAARSGISVVTDPNGGLAKLALRAA